MKTLVVMRNKIRNGLRFIGHSFRKPFLSFREIFLKDVYARLGQIEYRSFNRRFYAIEQLTEYLIGAKIAGDYLEFGVFQGTTFIHACKFMSPHFEGMNFIAFDSFEGLPVPKGIDAINGYSSHFYESQFSCSEEDFLTNVRRNGIDMKKVKTVRGWFDKTLLPEKINEYGIEKIAAVWIDCDLYESTVPVLKFITNHLTAGSVIVFDDWRCFRNHPDFGERRACRGWLEANPNIKLEELFSFGWHGIAFTVILC